MSGFFQGFKEGQRMFGETIGVIVNSALLSFVYIVAVGPTSLIGKMAGKKFLDTKPEPEVKSYWTNLDLGEKPMEEYYRQF